MDDNRTDLEKATAQVAGLERFLRARLINTMTRLFIALVLIGGTISALTPGGHFLESAAICLAVATVFAIWFIMRYLQTVRGLRTDPLREVTRLHKKRKVRAAGFVAEEWSSTVPSRSSEHGDSDASETGSYGVMDDIDVLGQKSADGVNRTDDPSRGPIE
jgi:hypothetical protein